MAQTNRRSSSRSKSGSRNGSSGNGRRASQKTEKYRFAQNLEGQPTMAEQEYLDYVNDRWIAFTGLTREQLLGEGWQQVVHPEDRERLAAAWAEEIGRAHV